MLFRNDKFIEQHRLDLWDDKVDDVIMQDFCVEFSRAMKDHNVIELTSAPSYINPQFLEGKQFRAEVHIYHPEEIRKIKEALHDLFKLENITQYDVGIRVREIAEMLGFAEKKQNAATE